MVIIVAIRFINLHENLEGYIRLAGLPTPNQKIANLYTDGSYSAEKEQAGFGAYLQHNNKHYCWGGEIRNGLIISRYEHEAMLQGLKLARSVGAMAINVYIDCKGLYEELIHRKTEWANQALELLDNCNVFLIFSHVGVYGNEFADELSRMYLNGLPQDGFYMEANDYRIFNVKRVAANYEEILGRIKKSKKLCEESCTETIEHSPPPKAKVEITQTNSTKTIHVKASDLPHYKKQIQQNQSKTDKSALVELRHPLTKQPYMIKQTLYNAIKKQREMEIERKGLKNKKVKDSYIAQEAHRRECARARSLKSKAA